MAKTWVLGDCHGAHLALQQCLERADFNPTEDTLISLGDICDGWPFVKETVEILQAIPNLIVVRGNHDDWAMHWARGNRAKIEWVTQGGEATQKSYSFMRENFPLDFFENSKLYYEHNNKLYVHGGFHPDRCYLVQEDPQYLMWDRDLVRSAALKHFIDSSFKYGNWDDVFVGHTTTQMADSLEPLNYCNVWMLDTGGGWSGKLTIMDVDTKEYWQSDLVKTLYPNIKGRN